MHEELVNAMHYCVEHEECGAECPRAWYCEADDMYYCKRNGYEGLIRDATDAIERLEETIEQQYETIAQLDADLEAAYNH